MTVRVFDAGLACCAVEVGAALRRLRELPPAGASGWPGGAAVSPPGGAEAQPAGAGAEPAGTVPGGLAAALGAEAAARPGGGSGPPGQRVHVLVVAGTVTDKLAPFVLRAFQETPEPPRPEALLDGLRVLLEGGEHVPAGGPGPIRGGGTARAGGDNAPESRGTPLRGRGGAPGGGEQRR